jgi:hypothetical protein
MENCSCGSVVSCLIGVSGLSAAATSAVVAASAVEASSPVCPRQQPWRLQRHWRWKASTVCNGAGLSSESSAEAFALVVLAAAVGTIFMSLCFVVLLQDRVFMVEIQCRC